MEREKLIEAAKMLYEHCKQNKDKDECNGCPLLAGGMCVAYEPDNWIMLDLYEVQGNE